MANHNPNYRNRSLTRNNLKIVQLKKAGMLRVDRVGEPWASGPKEILQHSLNLLQKDTDTNRRLAMLSIDNSVELMVKTYLGLPKRATGLQISRSELAEINESFPKLLDALEKYAVDKLEGIDLAEIDWYHRLRNELYHQGNGLTVEREKVVVYAGLAQVLFQRLFGFAIQVERPVGSELVGHFITSWSNLYQVLESSARRMYPKELWRGTRTVIDVLAEHGLLDPHTVQEINALRSIRNEVVHGDVSKLSEHTVDRVRTLSAMLHKEFPSPP